jgi:hypothetical protein
MRNIIKKILKEQEDDGFNWADSAVNSPAQVLENLELEVEWTGYIPEISKQIMFTMNPESFQPMARLSVENVEAKGYGSFGDDAHRHHQRSPLDEIRFGRSNWNSEGSEPIGEEEGGKLYNVMDAARDIKSYSEEAKQLTLEYKQKIQEITKLYAESLKELPIKHNFNGSDNYRDRLKLATVDSQGEIWTDDKWDESHGGGKFREYPGHDDVWNKKRRRGGFNGGDFPPRF